MKKLISILVVLAMLLGCANAEELFISDTTAENLQIERDPLPEVLNVVNTTKTTGAFFTDLWSNNTADEDVRSMLHGMQTVIWVNDIRYDFNTDVLEYQGYQDNDDGSRTFYLTIKTDLKYSDGSDITASDYVFSILLQAGPELAELGANETAYTWLDGYEDFHSGKSKMFRGVKLITNYSFSVTVKAECLPYFYENYYANVTPYPINAIAPNCSVEDDGEGAYVKCNVKSVIETDENGKEHTSAYDYNTALLRKTLFGENGYVTTPSIVSGPYKLVSYDYESGTVVFTANEYYPFPEIITEAPVLADETEEPAPAEEAAAEENTETEPKAHIENVTLYWANAEDALAGLLDGTYGLYNKAMGADILNTAIEAGFNYTPYGRRGLGQIVCSCDGLLADAKLRQAVAHVIDRDGFIEKYLGTFGYAVYSYYGIGQWMTQAALDVITLEDMTEAEMKLWDTVNLDELKVYTYDVDAAASLCAKYVKREEGLTLKMAVPEKSGAGLALAEQMTEDFKSAGVVLEVTEVDFENMVADLYAETRSYDLYFFGTNFAPVFDPTYNFSGEGDMSRMSDTAIYKAAQAMRETEPGDILGYYLAWFEFEKLVAEQAPVVGVYSGVYADFMCDTLQNYDISTSSSWPQAILTAYFGYNDAEGELFIEEGAESGAFIN